jgi:hypothetical protein
MGRSQLVIVCTILGVGSISCGPGSGPAVGSSSGLPRASTFGELTSAQAVILCDWVNERQGGYGRHVACADGSTQDTDPNQSECAAANAVLTDLCSMPTQAACAAVNACVASAAAR